MDVSLPAPSVERAGSGSSRATAGNSPAGSLASTPRGEGTDAIPPKGRRDLADADAFRPATSSASAGFAPPSPRRRLREGLSLGTGNLAAERRPFTSAAAAVLGTAPDLASPRTGGRRPLPPPASESILDCLNQSRSPKSGIPFGRPTTADFFSPLSGRAS